MTSRRSSPFLSCFGLPEDTMQVIDEVNSDSRRRSRRWISNWTFGCKKSDVKSVHVDVTTRKSKSVNAAPAEFDATLTVGEDGPVGIEGQKVRRRKWADMVKRQNGVKEVVGAGVESPEKKSLTVSQSFVSSHLKPLTHSKSLPSLKNHKSVKDSKAGGGVDGVNEGVVHKTVTPSKSPPPTKKQKPGTAAADGRVDKGVMHKTAMTRSSTLPSAKTQKPRKGTTADGGVDDGVARKARPTKGEFDSIIAMTILLAILVIMLLWGKLCAIICTCAWFFIAPRLIVAGGHSAVVTAEKQQVEPQLNMESVEYKKRVVLEGLLERKHRTGMSSVDRR